MKATICERYELELGEPTEGEPWFLDWVLRAPKQAGIHLAAGWHALSCLKDHGYTFDTAMEYFGGMGAQALMIEDLFDPTIHVVYDYAAPAVQHLRRQAPAVYAKQADSYAPDNYMPAELVSLDFGDLTIFKMANEGQHQALLNRVFDGDPAAVVITDVAARYLHLHRERYDAILGDGASASYETYLEALAEYVTDEWGYGLLAGFSHRWSTVLAFVRGAAPERHGIVPTPETPVGLVLA